MHSMPEPVQIEHPGWCLIHLCTAAIGGAHRSASRIVPQPSMSERVITVELVKPADDAAAVRILEDGAPVLRVSLGGARTLSIAIRDMAVIGRRPQR